MTLAFSISSSLYSDTGYSNLVVVSALAIDSRALGPWNARVCHKHIEPAVEVFDGFHNGLLDDVLVSHVDLVSLACRMLVICDARQL
jgi:hypothetical protein